MLSVKAYYTHLNQTKIFGLILLVIVGGTVGTMYYVLGNSVHGHVVRDQEHLSGPLRATRLHRRAGPRRHAQIHSKVGL